MQALNLQARSAKNGEAENHYKRVGKLLNKV